MGGRQPFFCMLHLMEPTKMNKIYLGDSVYAEIDGGMIKLTTNNGYPDDPRNVIYMEEEVFNHLVNWVKNLKSVESTI